jgi:hypothetical protein
VIALTFSTVKVFEQMKKMFDVGVKDIKIITILFDLAYLIKVLLNCTVLPDIYSYDRQTEVDPGSVYLWTIVPGVICDCLPLTVVMWLHHENYKQVQTQPEQTL